MVPSTSATKLVVTTEPQSFATAGSPFNVAISAEDTSGMVDTSYTGIVTLAIATGPSGEGLGGTTMLAVVDGTASFSRPHLDPRRAPTRSRRPVVN